MPLSSIDRRSALRLALAGMAALPLLGRSGTAFATGAGGALGTGTGV